VRSTWAEHGQNRLRQARRDQGDGACSRGSLAQLFRGFAGLMRALSADSR
jgi:hypothetical protein